MKKFILKQWYPTLPKEWKDKRGIVSFDTNRNGYKLEGVDGIVWIIGEHEFSNKDFWELIEEEKPLFITEDGVEVFSDIDNLFAINLTYFSKTQNTLRSSRWLIDNPSYKVFSLESNADEYILWNKPLLSLQDINATIKTYSHEFVELIRLAEKKVKQ